MTDKSKGNGIDTAEQTAAVDSGTEPRPELPAHETPGPEAADASAAELRRERDEYYEQLLRSMAEFDNFRKRVERERRELREAVAADILLELLPLVDDLERALRVEPTDEGAEPYRKGVELIHRQVLELLRKWGVRPIETLGADFDPRFHEAVAHETVGGRRPGEIVEQLRRGYMLGDRLLRPAMVKVAKA